MSVTEGKSMTWIEPLKVVLARLDEGSPTLSGTAESYLLTGEPQSALALVVTNPNAPQAFRLWSTRSDETDRRLCQEMKTMPPEVLARWARLMEVVFRAAYGNSPSLSPIGAVPLAEALLNYVISIEGGASYSVMEQLPIDHETVEAMMVAAGGRASDLLVAAFRPSSSYNHKRSQAPVRLLNGFSSAVSRHAEVLRPVVGTPQAERQLIVLEMLGNVSADVLPLFGSEIAAMATTTSSQVRSKAAPVLAKFDASEPLKVIATTGKPEERLNAFPLLWSGADPVVREWARQQAARDRAPRVRELAEGWARTEGVPAQDNSLVVEEPVIDWAVPVSDELAASLHRSWSRAVEQIRHHQDDGLLDPDGPEKLIKALRMGSPPALQRARSAPHVMGELLQRYFPLPELGLAGVTILLNQLGALIDYGRSLSDEACAVYNSLYRATSRLTLLEVSTALDQVGLDGPAVVFDRYRRSWGGELGQAWASEDVAPFVLRNLPTVLDAIATPQESYYHSDDAPYRALATLPELPATVVDALVAVAMGSRKTSRRRAQDALTGVAGIVDRAAAGLKDGKAETRTAAAQWLMRLGDPAAVPALEAAVLREKQDVPRGTLLDALESFGQPVEKYLDRDALATQAAAMLAKGMPKQLEWFPWDSVPAVRWVDSGGAVPVDVLKWFAVQAVKAKSPEPNVMLRKYCALFDPEDREALGQYMLEAWLAEDVRPVTLEEAEVRATTAASEMLRCIAMYPQHYATDPANGKSLEQLTAEYLPGFAGQPAGSAVGSKGLLALAAACARGRAADPVARYLKEWYGQRAAQGKALIAMLGWIEHPSATQLMLSVGSRFRTKSFQEEATKQAEALAERKGWSVGELADRTIPSAGFDHTGVIELSYGERVFSAVLRPDLTIELRSPEGKKISALPAARQSEDEDVVKAAKKSLTLAKKELKAIVQLQSQRLYEALCTERTWMYADWETYLNQHPVVRYLTQRLAWVATTGEGSTVFRPLDDGTLTDVDDNEVKLPADAVVAVAHDSLLDGAVVKAWQEHLVDYEVSSLFQQFGKGSYVLAKELSGNSTVTDFNGHLLEAFALRGRAGKLGYTRGDTQDGGWFSEYEKRFPTLGLTAVVSFTGNPLPEENRTVALTTLSFFRSAPGGPPSGVQLGDVPTVLLSEVYNDMRLMASDGTGFDPDWEKKSEY